MSRILTVLFLTCLSPLLADSLSPSLNDDVLGLIVFKADVQDPDGNLSSWNEEDDSPCNDWTGVRCNPKSNRVSDLVLDGLNLSGKLGRGLLQLKFLRKLSLARNNLTGGITLNFNQLSDLRVLDLSQNGFSGTINSDLFTQCGSLRSISLANNEFSGPVPDSVGSCSTLALLNLSGNQFSGSSSTVGLWSLPGLRSLDLSDNLLEGGLPDAISGLINLRALNLRNNRFSGLVPDGIGNCLLLRSIDLSRNSFSGEIPTTTQKLSLCNSLILSENQFSGQVPDWIGDMTSLETLDLSVNTFHGEIPDSFQKLQSLKILNVSWNAINGSLPQGLSSCENLLAVDVSHNSLTGDVPSWVFKLGLQQILLSDNEFNGNVNVAFDSSLENSREKLLILDISQNQLYGSVPSSIGEFSSLQSLNMAENTLVGSIPVSIGLLKSLMVLDLSKNRLNGSIPMEIGSLSSLTSLSLAHNEIMGSLPPYLAKLTNLETVDLCYNKLSGTIPKQLANLVHLQTLNISHNQLQGELPSGSFFNTIDPSSVSGYPSLCGAAVNRTCPTVLPKPIVLNPNDTESTPVTITQSLNRSKKILSISALIAIGAAAAIVIGVIAITVLNLHVHTVTTSGSAVAYNYSPGDDDFSRSNSTEGNSGKLVMFSGDPDFSMGTHALLNKDCELGRGGFGSVYRTMLRDGRSVAIKKLTVSSLVKSQEDFEREVKDLGKARHLNVVGLDGYYWTPSLQLIIYEYVSGGNLYKHLHECDGNYLTWNERFNIILGAARGLAHLHKINIIHYNLKSSNILLDASGEPKVADYGLARLLPMLDRYVLSSKIQSALGYMAPEFACKTVKITDKCDVYGFGVLVLEIITGKRPVEYMEDDVIVLCDMVREALEEGKVEECVDTKLQGKFPIDEAIPVMKLGLICTSQVPSNRPDMSEVVNILELIRCPVEESQDDDSGSSI